MERRARRGLQPVGNSRILTTGGRKRNIHAHRRQDGKRPGQPPDAGQCRRGYLVPSEVDVSIRPGWYYHAREDERVKSPQKLIDIYYSSIGKNSLLLLNLPPDKRLIHENDIRSLQGMRRILDNTFRHNLLTSARTASADTGMLTDNTLETYWQGTPKDSVIEVSFSDKQTFDRLMLQENITEGQRIERFVLECRTGNGWQTVAEGTTVGYKRILRFDPVETDQVRITIKQSRDLPQIAEMGFYKASEEEGFPLAEK